MRSEIPGGLNPGSGSLGPVLEFITYKYKQDHSLSVSLIIRTDSGVKLNCFRELKKGFMNEWLKEV